MIAAAALAASLHLPGAHADERIEGMVREVRVTHCDVTRRGGCAGTMILERKAPGGSEAMSIAVPLGTPISLGEDRVYLHALPGNPVIVTLETVSGTRVARAVRVVDPAR